MIVESSQHGNPNSEWLNSPGMWLTYTMLIFWLHFICLAVPSFSVATAWTVTNCFHNLVGFLLGIRVIQVLNVFSAGDVHDFPSLERHSVDDGRSGSCKNANDVGAIG